MAHDLNFENGEASMMYVGDVPWHGLGTLLETPPATAEAAIRAARLDWEVGLKPVFTGEGSRYYSIPDRQAVVRLDRWGEQDCPIYGLVGADYRPLQNRNAFSFFDPVVKAGAVHYETAGSLGCGERVWVLAKLNGPRSEFAIKGRDVVQKYLLLSNGHDGKTAVQVRFTPVRVVCQNTLSAALSQGKDQFKIYHDPSMNRRLENAQERVKELLGYYDEIEANFEQFANFDMDSAKLQSYLQGVFPDPVRRKGQTDRSFEESEKKIMAFRDLSSHLFEEGKGNEEPGIRGTLWAAYNGVTEVVDHHGSFQSPWQRMNSICFGEGERVKHRAFNQANAFLSTK
jgi:phage/plasmid-like protein (TIGR03299 family)